MSTSHLRPHCAIPRIDGEGNAGTSFQQAAIVCELRKPLVQDKYSVKAKAQQLMYGVMGYILYFDRGYIIKVATSDPTPLTP